jgi:hypothetical protein
VDATGDGGAVGPPGFVLREHGRHGVHGDDRSAWDHARDGQDSESGDVSGDVRNPKRIDSESPNSGSYSALRKQRVARGAAASGGRTAPGLESRA